jgi:hypothetical protein
MQSFMHMTLWNVCHNTHRWFMLYLYLYVLCVKNIWRGKHISALFAAGICVSEWQWCRGELSHFNIHQDSTRRIRCSVALAFLSLCVLHSLWSVKCSWECKSSSPVLLLLIRYFRVQSCFITDDQSVNIFWSEHPCGTCNQILLPVSMLMSEICGLVSLGCPYFTVSSETPPTWRVRLPYLYPPGTGWSSYTSGHWVPFMPTLRATVKVF